MIFVIFKLQANGEVFVHFQTNIKDFKEVLYLEQKFYGQSVSSEHVNQRYKGDKNFLGLQVPEQFTNMMCKVPQLQVNIQKIILLDFQVLK